MGNKILEIKNISSLSGFITKPSILKFDKNIIDKLKEKQDKAVKEIEKIENKIKNLKSQIKEPIEIINKVFAREFNYPENLWKEFGKGMTAGTQKSEIKEKRYLKQNFQTSGKVIF